jgi:predicted dehydrogenase
VTQATSAAGVERPVRIGFIGCGGNARGHMRRLGRVAGAQIVGVCDVVPALAEQAATETGAQAYTDLRALLERNDLDAMYLSIPVFAHGEPELAVIERGLPFFVEKPVAIDLDTARQVEAAVRRAGTMTCVGYQLRYCGSADLARAALADPSAGPVGLVHGRYWCGTGRAQPDHWRTQLARSGGQLVEQATHTIDMIRYLVGEVDEVFAYTAKAILGAGAGGDCPDVYAVSLRFAGGAVGTLSTTWAIHPADWGEANVVDIAAGERRLQWRITGVSVTLGKETEEQQQPDGSIDEVFVQAVRTGDARAIRSDYADAIRSLAISIAANESARTGRPVTVPALAPG